MVCLLNITLFFSFIIFASSQEEYIDICFIIFGEKEKDLNLKLNKKLMFIPNMLKFYIYTTENLYDKKLATIQKNTYFLTKASHSCSDHFVYEVPWSSQVILTVNMILFWGEQPSMMIDAYQMVVRPEFEPSIHEWDSLLNYFRIKIYLKHEKLNRNYLQQMAYITPRIDWNGKVRALLPGEYYCICLLTNSFFGIFIFDQNPVKRGEILKYYRLKINAFSKNGDTFMPRELIYLGNVFPCHPNLALKDKLKIFIKPTYYKIQFKLFGEVDTSPHIAEYVYHRGRFKLNTIISTFSFTFFEIEKMIFSIDMFNRKERMLIYPFEDKVIFCKTQIPEMIDNLKVSRLIMKHIDDQPVKILYFKCDMSTHEVGVYKIIRGSESEYFEQL